MSEVGAGQSASRRQVAAGGLLLPRLFCLLLVWTKESAGLADFSGYLTKLLRNHTVYACDGDHLSLRCPRHSTISVQSAYYGQAYHLCSAQQPEVMVKEALNCVASTTLQVCLWKYQEQGRKQREHLHEITARHQEELAKKNARITSLEEENKALASNLAHTVEENNEIKKKLQKAEGLPS